MIVQGFVRDVASMLLAVLSHLAALLPGAWAVPQPVLVPVPVRVVPPPKPSAR